MILLLRKRFGFPLKSSNTINLMTANEYPLSFHEINPDSKERMNEILNDPTPIILLLDGLEDARNLGAIFRLADACRITQLFLYQPNLNTDQKKLSRVARQTSDHISCEVLHSKADALKLTDKYFPIALEYTNKSIPFTQYQSDLPCMLIIGNERHGVSIELLEICKTSLHIPMLGQNSSMNVSVATGIVLYHLLGKMNRI